MITVNIREEDEFIKLGQALKKAGVVGSGVDAKMVILDGQVSVNGQNFNEEKNYIMGMLLPFRVKQFR